MFDIQSSFWELKQHPNILGAVPFQLSLYLIVIGWGWFDSQCWRETRSPEPAATQSSVSVCISWGRIQACGC